MNQQGAECPPVLLTVAGFDPSAGAGVAADLKTFAAHGCYGVAALTALTVQNTQGVQGVQPLPAEVLRAQLTELAKDMPIAGVKIGMLGRRANVQVVAEFLEKNRFAHVVLDPVLRASAGGELIEPAAVKEISKRLLPLATLVTPNESEAAALAGIEIKTFDDRKAAAQKLFTMGARAVVITGGESEKPLDLVYDGAAFTPFEGERVKSESTHGTGCTFSAAVLANLVGGRQLPDAVMLAKAYVAKAIAHGFPLGRGKGPLNHFYRYQNGQVVHSHSLHMPAEGPAHGVRHF
ncbi:MAG: bifunctional hydroxymethylpyrimidine kinase/phosphomethylpyrimidine kinase [Terriglobia bacterium]